MENEQIQEYCQEALKIAEVKGASNGLSFLVGEKFCRTFLQLKKARQKLQYLYPREEASEDHPLNKGGRALKMSYALTIQEHYSTPLEQVKHYELFLKEFVTAIKKNFTTADIQSYLDSSPKFDSGDNESSNEDMDYSDVLLEAEEILALEDIKRLLL
jgi:hypothetical protein